MTTTTDSQMNVYTCAAGSYRGTLWALPLETDYSKLLVRATYRNLRRKGIATDEARRAVLDMTNACCGLRVLKQGN